jgi:hypothetical protein
VPKETIEIPMELFDRLMDFMERTHKATWDPKFVGRTIKLGEKVWVDLIKVGDEQGFVPIHERMEPAS